MLPIQKKHLTCNNGVNTNVGGISVPKGTSNRKPSLQVECVVDKALALSSNVPNSRLNLIILNESSHENHPRGTFYRPANTPTESTFGRVDGSEDGKMRHKHEESRPLTPDPTAPTPSFVAKIAEPSHPESLLRKGEDQALDGKVFSMWPSIGGKKC
ncbi:hypothetical protein JTE90_029351 [Oedothorax gibbosus]|uniref:Uncharacterized protein n=1 Tax=Oedothorax gibbosus TaxID=931172 RepID=A0AAV6UE59_9ARAC|nr:hypothetical protein JTE90_029351 [Oedothorax gibbosus]